MKNAWNLTLKKQNLKSSDEWLNGLIKKLFYKLVKGLQQSKTPTPLSWRKNEIDGSTHTNAIIFDTFIVCFCVNGFKRHWITIGNFTLKKHFKNTWQLRNFP